jgi:hypothetical protein
VFKPSILVVIIIRGHIYKKNWITVGKTMNQQKMIIVIQY